MRTIVIILICWLSTIIGKQVLSLILWDFLAGYFTGLFVGIILTFFDKIYGRWKK